jgi:hypothetical protein
VRAISAGLDGVASLVERVPPGRVTSIIASVLLTVALALIIYAVNAVKLARWLQLAA